MALNNITDQKDKQTGKISDYSDKIKEYEQRMSQSKIQKEELIKAIHQKEDQLEDKEIVIQQLQTRLR